MLVAVQVMVPLAECHVIVMITLKLHPFLRQLAIEAPPFAPPVLLLPSTEAEELVVAECFVKPYISRSAESTQVCTNY